MLLAAASVNVAKDFLEHLGCAVEILGFTTVAWQGGRSRKQWLSCGKPPNPGRLCDLLHIVYRAPGDSGLDQINVTLPEGVATGCAVPLQVSEEGFLSQSIFLSIAPAGSNA